jgi:hypothetical protein
MPSILHRNAEKLNLTGYALTDSSIAYQQNGLVNASMTYVAAPLQGGREVERVFAVDRGPITFPPALDRQQLQDNALFLQNFTSDTAYGITTVNAQYVGAQRISGQGANFTTSGFERGTIRVEATAAIISRQRPAPGAALGSEATIGIVEPAIDFYRFAYRSRVAVAEAAVLDNDFPFNVPPVLDEAEPRNSMIVGWELVSRSLDFIPEEGENTSVEPTAGFDLRSLDTAGWLARLSDGDALPFGQLPIRVAVTDEIDPVTPTVKILRKRASVLAPARYIL